MLQPEQKRSLLAVTLVLPILLLLGMIAVPFFNTLYLSLTDKTVGYEPQFIGLKNYFNLMHDSTYWLVVRNTVVYMVSAVGIKLIFGMIFALALNENFAGRSFFRISMLLPWALPGLVAALTWKWMYNDTYGIINALLVRWHIVSSPVQWLSSKSLSLLSVIIVNVWRGTPFFLFSFLGALQTIDANLYEAAKIDGANVLKRFIYVTVPGINPVIKITVLLSSIWTFNDFENIFLITGGGPVNSSSVIATYTYEKAFIINQMAEALSVAISVVPVLVLLIIIYFKKGEQE